MNYYQKHIGDYQKKAGRLSILQHGVYNLLIDCCYDREKFPTHDEAIDWVWASTPEEIDAVDFVLRKFFHMQDDGTYVQKRISEELEKYRDYCKGQAEKGRKGGRPKKKPEESQRDKKETQEKPGGFSNKPSGNPDESREKPKPLTTNHKPLTNTKTSGAEPQTNLIDSLFEKFWSSGIRKTNRKKALQVFSKLIANQNNPEGFVEFLVLDIKKRIDFQQLGFDQMHPTTYLNGERWTDEHKFNPGDTYASSQHPGRKPARQTPAERITEQAKIAISQANTETGQPSFDTLDTNGTALQGQVGD